MARNVNLTETLGIKDTPSPVPPREPVPAAAPVALATTAATVDEPAVRKFTMLNGPTEDAQARELTDTVVRLAGLRATKGMRADVVRALIEIAADDPRLQTKIAKLLKSRVAPRMTARR